MDHHAARWSPRHPVTFIAADTAVITVVEIQKYLRKTIFIQPEVSAVRVHMFWDDLSNFLRFLMVFGSDQVSLQAALQDNLVRHVSDRAALKLPVELFLCFLRDVDGSWLARGLHVVGNGGIVGPDIELPLPQADQPSQYPPSVDPYPHVEFLHVVLLSNTADQLDHLESHLDAVFSVFLVPDVLGILVIGIRCR